MITKYIVKTHQYLPKGLGNLECQSTEDDRKEGKIEGQLKCNALNTSFCSHDHVGYIIVTAARLVS